MTEEGKHRKKAGEGIRQEETGKVENRFTKEQLLASGHFRDRRDIVDALLDADGLYTVKEVEEKMEGYMKGKVK